MKFSVVVASHFRPLSLEQLLISLDQQNFPKDNFEVIIVPSPKDSAVELVQGFSKSSNLRLRIEMPQNDPWMGKSAAFKRNYGVFKSSNEWVAFTDDDCVADPNWLQTASQYIDESIVALEGEVKIPDGGELTLTAKGMKSLTRSGGYQTCNMFYRKDIFLQVKGFDLNFPYYFEDSDLAWTVKSLGHPIPFAKGAIITHPVFPNNPWKLIDVAKRVEKLVYLEYKHPIEFKKNNTKYFGKAWSVFLFVGFAFLLTLPLKNPILSLAILLLYFSLIAWQVYRLYRGTIYSVQEIVATIYLNSYLPFFALYSFIIGKLKLFLRTKAQKPI